jgi:hypothetical protein
MPTKREREYYRMGYTDGVNQMQMGRPIELGAEPRYSIDQPKQAKRKLSAWNKFVKANSKKPRFRYARSNKINLKKMAVAFRKTKRR